MEIEKDETNKAGAKPEGKEEPYQLKFKKDKRVIETVENVDENHEIELTGDGDFELEGGLNQSIFSGL